MGKNLFLERESGIEKPTLRGLEENKGDDDCGIQLLTTGTIINKNSHNLGGHRLGGTATWESKEGVDEWISYNGGWNEDELNEWIDRNEIDTTRSRQGFKCYFTELKSTGNNFNEGIPFTSGNSRSYICSADTYWYECDKEHEGFAILGENYYGDPSIFVCEEKSPTDFDWTAYIDKDQDGYADVESGGEDCSDLPVENEEHPYEDLDELGAMPLDELRTLLHSNCIYPRDAGLAVCINPKAPEVCGDRINNDCRAETSPMPDNNCNNFQAGCEQRNDIPLTNTAGENVDELENLLEEGEEPIFPEYKNIRNGLYSWLDLGDGNGYCCGYQGVDDLGLVRTDVREQVDKLCLTNDKYLVGYAPNSEEGSIDAPPGWEVEGCTDKEWCWVKASSEHFKIMTIKKSGEEPYDVVSDFKSDYFNNISLTSLLNS